VVLSDHGQSQGATFRTRYGQTLEDVVQGAIGAPTTSPGPTGPSDPAGEESWGYAGGALEEIAAGPGMAAKAVSKAANRRREASGDVLLGPESDATAALPEQRTHSVGDGPATGEAVVLASGNCGLVYLTRDPTRMSRERIDELYPALLPTLRAHPGIGFLLVRSADRGALVLSADGELELTSGVLTGTDPLAGFGAYARRQVGRTDTFTHCPDIMVNSRWDEQTGEVAAFEELVGSHGGMGGDQTHPFVLYPSTWSAPDGDLFGAEAVHRQFRRWLADLGQTAYDDVLSDEEAVHQSEEAPMAEVHDRSTPGGAGSC
jgi:hypothetical protein